MRIDKLICLVFFGFLLIGIVTSFSYEETDEGNPYYFADADVYVPNINIEDVVILSPTSEPNEPKIGMIYFDKKDDILRFYDGNKWRTITFDGTVSKVSSSDEKDEEEEEREEETDLEISDSGGEDESSSDIDSEESSTEIQEEECTKICEEVCEPGEKICEEREEVCEEVCSEECSGEGEEEECSEVCEEVCEPGEEICEEGEEVCEEVCSEECSIIPEQLFDISLRIDENIIETSDDLFAIITFESFGRVPTPVSLKFEILDENNNKVYQEKDSLVVEVEEVKTKSFKNLNLVEGNYRLVLTTLYDVDVQDAFIQEFEVKTKVDFFEKIGNLFRKILR